MESKQEDQDQPEVPEDFRCMMVCHEVCLVDPQETQCCHALIHLGCYNKPLLNKEECPGCRHRPFEISPAPVMIIRLIKASKTLCPFCKQVTTFGDLAEHKERFCKGKKRKCMFRPCELSYNKDDL